MKWWGSHTFDIWEWVKISSFFGGNEHQLNRPPAAVKQHRSLPTEFHTPKQSQLAQQSLVAIRVAIQKIERTKVGSISSTIHNSNNFRDGFNIAIDQSCVLDVQRRCFLIAEMTWNKPETGLRWATLSPNIFPSKNKIYKLYIYIYLC